MKFGMIDNFILFGGEELLLITAKNLSQSGANVLVATCKRHGEETLGNDGRTLIDHLKQNRIPYMVSDDICDDKEILDYITSTTLGISFGAGWIFKKEFIDLFNGRLVNLHGAQLPRDRGAGGFSWRIMRGDRKGVSLIHQIDSGVDTGDVLIREEYVYPDSCRIPCDFRRYTIHKYQSLLNSFFLKVKKNEAFSPAPQDESMSTYWPRLNAELHGVVDWSWSFKEIERFICAFDDPYVGASTYINGKRVRLRKCFASEKDEVFHPFQCGMIFRIHQGSIFVAAKGGNLAIQDVLSDKGDRILPSLHVGERFYSPSSILEKSLLSRVRYLPNGSVKVDGPQ